MADLRSTASLTQREYSDLKHSRLDMSHNCSRCGVTCAGIQLVRPAPDPEIEALLRTNLPPSEAQEAFFRKTRREGTPRLAELEARIADAQAKMDVLLHERDNLV
ncbi:hypothetical protein IW261DRAFT_1612472 [Armillaria novae-zelandiae]|uniref:Uncharacterized protein n=1 Tax=Armillaria novae-zelandiae TaxID=153914 RepID=A0AA39TUT6_9AGAR|nr:hypothetical protein IW261DRAFT_1612472 [Armillaria novae-zelandiae]